MKKKNNRLDEMQERKLLQIEHNGFWISFWLLAVGIFLQMFLFGPEHMETVVGESIILLFVSLYIVCACIRNGIWDRTLAPTKGTNIKVSLLAGFIMGIVHFGISYKNYHKFVGSIATFLFMFIMVSSVCFIALSVCTKLYQKKVSNLEKEEEKYTHL